MDNTKPSLKAEFELATKPFLIYLATTIIWVSFAKDIVRVGFRPDWLAIRLGYLPFVWAAYVKARRLPNRFYELPLWASAFYITAFCSYFSLSTGSLGSDSIYGLVQFYFGIAIMPITAASFFTIISSSVAYYVLVNVIFGGPHASPPPMIVSNVTPLLVFAALVFVITSRIRTQKLRLQGELIDTLSEQQHIIETQSKELAEAQTKAALGKLASSVAHDIRSPLAALSVVSRATTGLNEEMRVILRNATSRIETIAGSLLTAYKTPTVSDPVSESRSSELLSALIEAVVCEKQLEWQQKSQIDIRFEPTELAYGHFASVEATLFSRILSNLINNSAEAMSGRGEIQITLGSSEKQVFVDVADSGTGMPEKLIQKILSGEESTTKATGHGIGLSNAIRTLKAWDGRLAIRSNEGEGTCIRIELPRAATPKWFVSELDLSKVEKIVVIDDDPSIHRLWSHKFTELTNSRSETELIHLYSPEEALKQIPMLASPSTLFLVDYEFIGSTKSGIDVIRSIQRTAPTVLVTSRFEDASIRESCSQLGIGLIPKGLASCVPLAPSESNTIPTAEKAVLIDDDTLVHRIWQMQAHSRNKQLKCFSSFDDFQKSQNEFALDTAIYVDVTLANNVSGETVAQQLHEYGFQNIYLATGHNKDLFAHLKFLKGVCGKDPPW
jgi:signal transduction histidine kinase